MRFSTFDDLLAACGITGLRWPRSSQQDWKPGPEKIWGWAPGDDTLLKSGEILIGERRNLLGCLDLRSDVVGSLVHEALHFLCGNCSNEDEGGMLALNRALASGIEDRDDRLDALCRRGFSYIDLGEGDASHAKWKGHSKLWDDPGWKGCVDLGIEQGLITFQGCISIRILGRMSRRHAAHPHTDPSGFEILNPKAVIWGA